MKVRLFSSLICLISVLLAASYGETPKQEFIVKLKHGKTIGDIHHKYGTRTVRYIPTASLYLVDVDGEDATGQVLKKIQKEGSVDAAEGNGNVQMFGLAAANEINPGLVQQMASLLDGQTLTSFYGTTVLKAYVEQEALAVIHANEARALSTGLTARVAYIDTGVDPYHSALRPWLDPGIDLILNHSVSEFDGLSQQMASLLDQQMASLLDNRLFFLLNQTMASLLDSGSGGVAFPPAFGHGTLVAGMIHAVAPEARIVPIKAFDAYGATTTFTIIEALYQAMSMDVDVVNVSFSTTQTSDALRRAVSDVRTSGIYVVASVGNDGRNAEDVYPANYPGVYGVAATDLADRLATFSNYGKSASVSAPGAYVISTAPGGRYAAAWGTSFSAPMVSGAIALVASAAGHGRSDAPRVMNNADSIDALNPGFAGKLGRGRINIYRALN